MTSPLRRALTIGLIYAVVGALWVWGGDYLLALLIRDPNVLATSQVYKGWTFIALTALLLVLVLQRQFRRYRKLARANSRQASSILELSQFREAVIDNASVWISVHNAEGRILVWNKAAELISGYLKSEVLGRDVVWEWLYPESDYRRELVSQAQAVVRDGLELSELEVTIRTRTGDERRMLSTTQRFIGPDGAVAGAINISIDVTEQRKLERRARASDRQLKTLMDNLPGMAYRSRFDDNWTMTFVSDGCRELTGYAPGELVGNGVVSFVDMIVDADNDENRQKVNHAVALAEPYSIEYALTRRDGRRIWVWERGRSVQIDDELMLEGILMDISERKRLEEELAHMATRDALTGLYNRRECERRLDEAILRSKRNGRPVALLWIDLDHFKAINDRHGHGKGDEVLRCVSRLLADSVRSVDTAARYGGEEFLVVLPERGLAEACETAERLRRLIERQSLAANDENVLRLSASIGVAIYPDDATSAELLRFEADQAMYTAKRAGRNQVCHVGQSAGETRKNPSRHS